MAGFRILDIAKPIQSVFPEVYFPYERVQFDDKIIYTVFTGLIYLFLQQLPVVGYHSSSSSSSGSGSLTATTQPDQLYYLRNVFAMGSPHSILEFGLFPIIATTVILQLLAGMKLVKINFSKKQERHRFQTLNKLFSLALTFVLTNLNIFVFKYYGTDDSLTFFGKILINIQTLAGTLLSLLFIEVIDKGYGFQSGILCLHFLSYTTSFVNNIIGITTVVIDENGTTEPQGSLINFTTSLRDSKHTWVSAIVNSFTRPYLPNLTQVLFIALIGGLVVYWSHYRYELTIRSTKTKNVSQLFPIKMLYTGGISIYFTYTVIALFNILLTTVLTVVAPQFLKVDNNLLVLRFPFNLVLPPRSIFPDLVPNNLLQLVVFPAVFIAISSWFSYKWMLLSGSSPSDLAAQFKEQGITLQGKRESAIKQDLMKLIKPASIACGLVLGSIVCAGELIGLKGDAAGMVLAVSGCFSLLELIVYEFQQTGSKSLFASIIGGGF